MRGKTSGPGQKSKTRRGSRTAARLRGYWTYVSPEAIDEWMRVPICRRFAWIEEMIRFESGLPVEIREAHRRVREGVPRKPSPSVTA